MARGLYEVTTISEARQFTVKKTGEIRTVTGAVIDGQPVDLPGNGIAPFTRCLVYGDLRRYEGRQYFADDVPVVVIQSQETLKEVVDTLRVGGK